MRKSRQQVVEINGSRVHLTSRSTDGGTPGDAQSSTLTKEMFLSHLYGGMDEPEMKIIDVFICKLRKKLANASAARTTSRRSGARYVLRNH